MKKIISLIVCIAIVFSFSVVSFAAGETNFTLTASATEVNEGDTFTITLSTAAIKAASLTGGFYIVENGTAAITCTDVKDGMGYTGYISAGGPFPATCTDFATTSTVNANNTCGFALAATAEANYPAQNIIVATFTADKAGTVDFSVYESSDGTDGKTADRVGTISVTIKGSEPVLDEAIEVGATSTDDAEAGTRTWAVEVGADLIANGKIKAVLTNSHADVAADNTQEVALSFGTVDKDSEMDCQFNVVVKFQDYAKYAATTNLDIVKAN